MPSELWDREMQLIAAAWYALFALQADPQYDAALAQIGLQNALKRVNEELKDDVAHAVLAAIAKAKGES